MHPQTLRGLSDSGGRRRISKIFLLRTADFPCPGRFFYASFVIKWRVTGNYSGLDIVCSYFCDRIYIAVLEPSAGTCRQPTSRITEKQDPSVCRHGTPDRGLHIYFLPRFTRIHLRTKEENITVCHFPTCCFLSSSCLPVPACFWSAFSS